MDRMGEAKAQEMTTAVNALIDDLYASNAPSPNSRQRLLQLAYAQGRNGSSNMSTIADLFSGLDGSGAVPPPERSASDGMQIHSSRLLPSLEALIHLESEIEERKQQQQNQQELSRQVSGPSIMSRQASVLEPSSNNLLLYLRPSSVDSTYDGRYAGVERDRTRSTDLRPLRPGSTSRLLMDDGLRQQMDVDEWNSVSNLSQRPEI